MKYIVNNQVVLSREPEGPLAAYIDSFAGFVSDQGYALSSVHQRVRLAAGFSRWLRKSGVKLHRISSHHLKRYLQYRTRQLKPCPADSAALRHLFKFLHCEGVIPADKIQRCRLKPTDKCAQAFEQYLRGERALANATVINYMPFIRDFLNHRFGNRTVRLSRLSARDVVRFVQHQARRLHRVRAKLMTNALRSFLNYARYNGEVTLDLAAAVPAVANWSMPSIPRAIAADQVRQLLASIDLHTAVGRRNYAILLLLARLGLRSGEVAFLELDDIDWNIGSLRVHGKNGMRNGIHLPAEVGKAIAAYLQDGRPVSSSRRVFLRAKAPNCGFRGSSGVGSIVRDSLKRAGVNAPTYGAHQFRHGLATEMLRHGASLSEIGDVLGHQHPQTTMIYTKVDLDALRTLALPWPGGVR
jgi:integrase/recombinase XerD